MASITPSSITDPAAANTYTQSFTIAGSGFESGAVVTSSAGGALTFGTATVAAGGASLTVSATVAHLAVPASESITVTNPDNSTSTAANILGFGILPPAPGVNVTETNNPVAVGAVTNNTEALAATGGEAFGAGAAVTFTGTNVTGTVKILTATSATVALNVPAYAAPTTLGAAAAAAATSITIGAGLPAYVATANLTIVDGASTEIVTASAYNATSGVATVSALANAHASGVTVEIPQAPSITSFSIVGQTGEAPIVVAPAAIVLTAPAPAFTTTAVAAGNGVIGITTPLTLTWPGAAFTTGATATNIAGTHGGTAITGTVTVTDGNDATLNLTIPSTQAGSTTLDTTDGAQTAGDTWIDVTSNTGITAGEVLTISSDTGTTNTEQVTVVSPYVPTAPANALAHGFLVPTTTALRFTHTGVGAVVTGSGITAAITNTATATFLITSGSGNTSIVTVGAVANGVTAPATENTQSVGQGATALSVTLTTAVAATSWAVPLGATPANTTVTSSNTSVTFGTPTVVTHGAAGVGVITVPVTVTSAAALAAAVPVTVTVTGLGAATDPAGLAIVAAPVVTSDSGSTTVTSGSNVFIAVAGSNFATVGGVTVQFWNGGANDPAITATAVVNSATSLTVHVTGVTNAALAGSDTLVVTNTANGGVGSLANALTVVAPLLTGASSTTGSVYSSTFTGVITLAGSGFTPGALGVNWGGIVGTAVTYVSPTSITFNMGTARPAGPYTVTLTDNGQTASMAFTVVGNPTVTSVTVDSGLTSLAQGSTAVPVTIATTIAASYLPGATVTFADAGVTGTITSITPFAIHLTVSVGANSTVENAAADTVTVTNTNGGTVTAPGLAISGAPFISSVTQLLSGKAATLTITGSGFVTGAVVTSSNPAIVTFGTATVVSATEITVMATPVSFSGATALTADLIVTNPAGAGTATSSGGLVINPGPTVTGTYYIPTFANNVEYNVTGTGFEQGMTAASSNTDYTVAVASVNATGTVATLLVTTDSNATSGTSSNVTFTNPDGGSVAFALNGGPAPSVKPPVVLKISKLSGTVVTGGVSIIKITGTGFTGQPTITSNAAGTTAKVTGDTGKVLTVRVTVKAGTKKGVHHFTITFKSGKSLGLNYSQH